MSIAILPYHLVDNQVSMRNKVLVNAVHLFSLDSYHNVSLDKIAKACGIRKQSVLHHFSSKQSIVVEAVKAVTRYHQEKLTLVIEAFIANQASAVELLVDTINELLYSHVDGRFLCNMALHLQSTATDIRRVTLEYFELWQNTLVTLLNKRNLSSTATELCADLVSQLQGAIVMNNVLPEHNAQTVVLARLREYLTK